MRVLAMINPSVRLSVVLYYRNAYILKLNSFISKFLGPLICSHTVWPNAFSLK